MNKIYSEKQNLGQKRLKNLTKHKLTNNDNKSCLKYNS